MTAIFAYIRNGSALIAADSKRRDPLGLFAFPPVTKVYSWGDTLLFAGAGNGPNLERLAKAMLADASFSRDERGFLEAFSHHQAIEYPAAVSRAQPKAAGRFIAGTFVVAVCATLRRKAHLQKLDFKTGLLTRSKAHLMTDGTNPTEFKRFSRRHLSKYAGGQIPGEIWASTCMTDASALCPGDVDWPVDVLIAHPNGHAYPGVASTQLTGASSASNPSYLI